MESPESRRGIEKRQEFDPRRRDFLKAALGGLVLAGLGSWGLWSIAESNKRQEPAFVTDDQKAAKGFLEEVQSKGEAIEVVVINPEDVNKPVNVRKNPAILYDNILTKVEPGKRFGAIIVGSVAGLQQTDPNLAGVWVAVEINKATGKIGFIHSNYVKRTDREVLTAGQVIYDLRPY